MDRKLSPIAEVAAELGARRSAAIGAFLGLGAPLGWMALQSIDHNGSLLVEISSSSALYLYLTFGSVLAFFCFGAILGKALELLRSANDDLGRLATVDALTGLGNRHSFNHRIEEQIADADRHGEPLSLIMLDLDHFKRVNDRLGHLAGDEVLRRIAETLQEHTRPPDVVARFGGEEIVVAMPRSRLDTARQAAERLRIAIEQSTITWEGQTIEITASFGVAEWAPNMTAPILIDHADEAMYAAKRAGRNQVCCATD